MNDAVIFGLSICQGFLPATEQKRLIDRIDLEVWNGQLKRRVQHYGYHYKYRHQSGLYSDAPLPFPEWAKPLIKRTKKRGFTTLDFD